MTERFVTYKQLGAILGTLVLAMVGGAWAVIMVIADISRNDRAETKAFTEARIKREREYTNGLARQFERQVDDNDSKINRLHERMNAWVKAGWVPPMDESED